MNFFEATLTKIIKETDDIYSFILEVPKDFTWKAGQHSLFKFKDYKVDSDDKEIRVFSIASDISENMFMFTTRIAKTHTSFKEILLNKIKINDKLLITQPKGDFSINNNYKKSFILGGGVGITPIRAILKGIENSPLEEHNITAIYTEAKGDFIYKKTFEDLRNTIPDFEFDFITDIDIIKTKIENYAKINLNSSEYLISGPPAMNKYYSELLENIGINKNNIKLDNFMGY